ncbi:hypothetical protein Halar_1314 [halophilic archaeon DL31]|jgi:putative flippase GtrA|nr:hypothetical protein Halar_1314 [halophilic archaeon DL31]
MSDDQDTLHDQSLPGSDPDKEGRLLNYVIVGVLAILLYGGVTLLLAATNLG